jgi:hypothetical protein
MIRGSYIVTSFLMLLNFMDAAATTLNIRKYGVDVEQNPIMKWIVEHFDYTGMFVMKLFFIGILFFGLSRIAEEKLQVFVVPSLWYLSGIYTVIVFYGLRMLEY